MLLQQVPTTENPIVLYVWFVTISLAVIVVLVAAIKFLYKKVEEKNQELITHQRSDTERYIHHSEKMTSFLTAHSEKITQAVDDNSRATDGLTAYIKTRDETLRDILNSLKK